MIILFVPSAAALLVITALWLSNQFTRNKDKPMLEQVADAQAVSRRARYYEVLHSFATFRHE
jgi:predicted outer membrane lipoprotein